jgi:hypothetical protein
MQMPTYEEFIASLPMKMNVDGAGRIGDWIQTASGKQFWPFDPRPEDVFIEDIAASLAQINRYNGHTVERRQDKIVSSLYELKSGENYRSIIIPRSISVLQHTLLMVRLYDDFAKEICAANIDSTEAIYQSDIEYSLVAVSILLHDAPESYLGDFVRPIKKHIPYLTEIENNIHDAIARKFRLPLHNDPRPPMKCVAKIVKYIDDLALKIEVTSLMAEPPTDWNPTGSDDIFKWDRSKVERNLNAVLLMTPVEAIANFIHRFNTLIKRASAAVSKCAYEADAGRSAYDRRKV